MNQENMKKAPALCRWIANQWDCEQVIVIGIDGDGQTVTATYGTTPRLCQVAKVFGGVAIEAIEDAIKSVVARAGGARGAVGANAGVGGVRNQRQLTASAARTEEQP